MNAMCQRCNFLRLSMPTTPTRSRGPATRHENEQKTKTKTKPSLRLRPIAGFGVFAFFAGHFQFAQIWNWRARVCMWLLRNTEMHLHSRQCIAPHSAIERERASERWSVHGIQIDNDVREIQLTKCVRARARLMRHRLSNIRADAKRSHFIA